MESFKDSKNWFYIVAGARCNVCWAYGDSVGSVAHLESCRYRMQRGDKIKWTYWHYLNSKNRVQIAKLGVFVRFVAHRHGYAGQQRAIVHFDGNKRLSSVTLASLSVR